MDSFDVALLRRSLGDKRRHSSIKTLYAHRSWVDDLDIVNELGGHTGCVNALSWSKQGHLLASGSDDTYLNIWDYNPSNLAKPFTLNTSVSTGHRANIFSVKFMPHSGDRTVITCAGDCQVRVFDLEYSGSTQDTARDSSFTTSTRSGQFYNFFRHARWLNDGNTNARVYRSHGDRVKRVVTESSPHLFLTCSEDGEVRQWDLRQPSSAYPSPRGTRGYRTGADSEPANVPPPLISYRAYSLDLNSISCSGSQPQYIALGGAHLHCFLHDRRMLGRDLMTERGQTPGFTPTPGTGEDEAMSEATRCVRRFAPNNKRKMGSQDHCHITACKISDANPNEMVVSWSGDHVYSFDFVKSPDAREEARKKDQAWEASRLRHQKNRKRKRDKLAASSSSLADTASSSRRLRKVGDDREEVGQTALRVRYENDQNVANSGLAQDTLISDAQRQSERVARALVKLRKTMFDFSDSVRTETAEPESSSDLSQHTATFTDILGQCSSLLHQMDEIIGAWSYPLNPTDEDVTLQNTLRRNRQASWRFVQASGCLARTLGGTLQTASPAGDELTAIFDQIRPAAREGKAITPQSRFCYDFLKAILLWIGGGAEAVLAGFQPPQDRGRDSPRYPLSAEVTVGSLPEKLGSYFSELASEETPIINVDANQFERDDTRVVFSSQMRAVTAFTRALAGFELGSNDGVLPQNPASSSNGANPKQTLDKGAAARFWCIKVGRSLLMEAAKGVTFDFVTRAFGGLESDVRLEDSELITLPNEVHAVEENKPGVELTGDDTQESFVTNGRTESSPAATEAAAGSTNVDVEMTPAPTTDIEQSEQSDDEDLDEDENDGGDSHEFSSDSDSEADSDSDHAETHPLFRHRIAFGRSRQRASVNLHVPYDTHSRVYKGHCNTHTVKDVNFYGLNDEYVVSGSDDGHFFIWDRKTTEIVNILEGDGEVVNVIQGHPYEPMIACSGIDSTVKIFGVGARERASAEEGREVANPGGGVHSSLRLGGRQARMARMQQAAGDDNDDPAEEEAEGERPGRGLRSRKAMHRSYEIMSQNDAGRRRGLGEAYVTDHVLQRLAQALQSGQLDGAVNGGIGIGIDFGVGADGETTTVVLNENCGVQ